MAGYLQTNNIDFQSLRGSLQAFLSQQDEFKDWNFAGSNLSTLVDLLTMNTHLQALYLNFVASEMFLDSAQLRESIVSHAKELGYAPRSVTSAVVNLGVQVIGTNLPGEIVLPAQFSVRGTAIDGTALTFFTNENTVLRSSQNWTAANVAFYEGRIITENFPVSNTSSNFFPLSSANVDVTSIQVTTQTSPSDTNLVPWEAFSGPISSVGSNSQVWFLQGYLDNYYQIEFGNGSVGAALPMGGIVNVTYRETSGPAGNGITSFTPLSAVPISGAAVVITTPSMSAGGTIAESNSSIAINAPLYAQTKGIAVTATDYTALLKKQFPQFSDVQAFGGEDAFPEKRFGTVIVTAKMAESNVIPVPVVKSIIQYLTPLMPLGISLSIQQPIVFDVYVDVSVNYRPSKLQMLPSQLSDAISVVIDQFDTGNLEMFGVPLWGSELDAAVSAVDPSILGIDSKFRIAYTAPPGSSNFSLGVPILAGTVQGVDGTAITDDTVGNLYLGSTVIGTLDYATGNVTVTVPSSYQAGLVIMGGVATHDVPCLPGSVLSLLSDGSTVTLVPYGD